MRHFHFKMMIPALLGLAIMFGSSSRSLGDPTQVTGTQARAGLPARHARAFILDSQVRSAVPDMPYGAQQHPELVDVVSPQCINIADDGQVFAWCRLPGASETTRVEVTDTGKLNDDKAAAAYVEYVKLLHGRGIKVLPMITSVSPPAPFLKDPAVVKHAVMTLTRLCENYNFDGFVVDIENYITTIDDGLPEFVEALHTWTSGNRRLLISTIDAAFKIRRGFEALANNSDALFLMCYDYRYPGTVGKKPSGPTDPIDEIEKDLRRIIGYGIPAEKLLIGVPLYAWGFTSDSDGKALAATFSWVEQWRTYGRKNSAQEMWDPKTQKQYLTYAEPDGTKREVWYNDKAAYLAMFKMAKSLGMGGVATWAEGGSSPSNKDFWPAVQEWGKVRGEGR